MQLVLGEMFFMALSHQIRLWIILDDEIQLADRFAGENSRLRFRAESFYQHNKELKITFFVNLTWFFGF